MSCRSAISAYVRPLEEGELQRRPVNGLQIVERADQKLARSREGEQVLGVAHLRARVERHASLRVQLAETIASSVTSYMIDAQVSHEDDEPSGDAASFRDVVLRSERQADERVVHDILRIRRVAHDAHRDRVEDRRIPVVEEADRLHVTEGRLLHALDIRGHGCERRGSRTADQTSSSPN